MHACILHVLSVPLTREPKLCSVLAIASEDRQPGLAAMVKHDNHAMTWYDHSDSYSLWYDHGKIMSWSS